MVIFYEERAKDRSRDSGHDRPMRAMTPDWVLAALLLALLIAQTGAKMYVALTANALWDEAHFVIAGRHPDWGYPDIPAGPALLAAMASALFGDTLMGLRAIALAAAQTLPFAIYFLARQFTSHRDALWAAIIAVFLPTTGLLGAFYYPEVFLQLALVLMLAFLVRAIHDDRWYDWLLTGLAGAVGLFIHYRFALAGAGVLVFLLATSQGRSLFLRPGLYLAGLIALLGLGPAIWYNIRESFAAIEFQAAARHRWAFWPPGLLHTLEQALIVTPIFFAGLIGAVVVALRRWRESESAAGLVVIVTGAIFLPYTLMAPFNKAYLYHWPFMAYAPLIVFMPQAFGSFIARGKAWFTRFLRAAAIGIAPVFALVFATGAAGVLVAWAHPDLLKPTYQRFLSGDYERWSALNASLETARRVIGAPTAPVVIVGHIPAVRLEFPNQRIKPLFVAPDTDDPLKGFDLMRERWNQGLDALALDYPDQTALIAIPDAAYVLDQQPDIDLRLNLCRRFESPRKILRTELKPGLRSIDIYEAKVRPAEAAPPTFCGFLPTEYMFKVERGATLPPEGQNLAGIAVHPSGVTKVEVLLNGDVLGIARLGLDPTDGRVSRALAFDPRYPKIFWDYHLKNENLAPGPHRLAIRVTRGDGTVAFGGERVFYAGTGLETLQADLLDTWRNITARLAESLAPERRPAPVQGPALPQSPPASEPSNAPAPPAPNMAGPAREPSPAAPSATLPPSDAQSAPQPIPATTAPVVAASSATPAVTGVFAGAPAALSTVSVPQANPEPVAETQTAPPTTAPSPSVIAPALEQSPSAQTVTPADDPQTR